MNLESQATALIARGYWLALGPAADAYQAAAFDAQGGVTVRCGDTLAEAVRLVARECAQAVFDFEATA
jgi:hypothetical protein